LGGALRLSMAVGVECRGEARRGVERAEWCGAEWSGAEWARQRRRSGVECMRLSGVSGEGWSRAKRSAKRR
jgi:hypothetical protein